MGEPEASLLIHYALLPQMKSLAQLAAGWTVEVPPRPPSPAEHLLGETLTSWPAAVLPGRLRLVCCAESPMHCCRGPAAGPERVIPRQ